MRFPFRSITLFAVVLVLILSVTGCHRQRAENSLRKTRQKLSEIELNYDGANLAPQDLQNIQNRVDQATQTLESDASAAFDMARQAATEADQLLESVKPRYGQERFSEAEQEIRIADINDLPREEPTRYQRIRDLKIQADAAKLDNKWDDVIRYSNQIIDEVRAGLATLRNNADRARMDAELALTNLTKAGGSIYAPEVVVSVRTDIDLAIQISDDEQDYRLAATRFTEAKNRAEQGIIQVLREKSREALEEIEGYLTDALLEGAKQFKDRDYQTINRQYESVMVDYREGRYNAVIEASRDLSDRARKLVIDTKRAASDDHIQTMEANINELDTGGILEYIPGALDNLTQMLAEAREIRVEDTEEAFDRIKAISIDAADEYERRRNAFQTMAQDAIRDARNSRETALAVYREMDRIFDPVVGELSPEQVAFESQKRTRQVELGRRLDEAETNLVNAELHQSNGEFRSAIIRANRIQEECELILAEIYHTVAHNAAIELANLISRYERDGARQYAAEELQRSTTRLEDVKATIEQGSFDPAEYKRAVEKAAETRADVELMAQRIAGRATESLREARNTLVSASSDNTRRYRAAELGEVQRLIEQAESDLQAERLKIALETAQRATMLALQAETDANRLAAEREIEDAQQAIVSAQQAGAESYAGREVEDAQRLLGSARGLVRNAEYVKAQELAISSHQRAQSALYKKINDAESAISSATAVGGWGYNSRSLGEAGTKLRNARSAMEQGSYRESHRLADSARSQADSLTNSTKAHNFRERVSRIRTNLDEGTRQGINFFQPEESADIRVRLASLENEYTAGDYERIMAQVELIEGKLRMTLDETDQLVTDVADQLDERLDRLVGAGATAYAAGEIADARKRLGYARTDYRRGDYKAAHSNLDNAIKLVREVETREDEVRYSAELRELFAEYRDVQVQFSNVLSLNPDELRSLAVGTAGNPRSVAILAQITPNEFRTRVDELYSRALIMKAPRNQTRLHESVISAFNEGRLAAINFESLVILQRLGPNEMNRIVDDAYLHMNNSNRMIGDIESQIVSDEIEFSLIGSYSGTIVNTFE